MTSSLPRPRSVLLVLSTASLLFLAVVYRGSTSDERQGGALAAKAELIQRVNLLEIQTPRLTVRCTDSVEGFLAEEFYITHNRQKRASKPGCSLRMLETLKSVLGRAESLHEAEGVEVALAVARYNSAVVGRGSLLEQAIAGNATLRALALVQRSAALSKSPELRAEWRRRVGQLNAVSLPHDSIEGAVLLGETRALLQSLQGQGPLSVGEARKAEFEVPHAMLASDLEAGASLSRACSERGLRAPFCQFLVRVVREQEQVIEEIALLESMLSPRL